MSDAIPVSPWYREPWPWLLMAGPAVVVVAGFVTLGLALSGSDGLVVDDYYKQGKAINQSLQRDAMARTRQIAASLHFDDADGAVRAVIRRGDGSIPPPVAVLTLVHATRSHLDRRVELALAGDAYTGRMTSLAPGKWHLVLEDAGKDWRLTKTLLIDGAQSPHLELTPAQ